MKTNYAAHDPIYQARRAANKPGWQEAESLRKTLASLAQKLESKHCPRNGRVLELGCGAGDLSLFLAAKGFDVHGVDIAPTAIDWAKEKATQRGLTANFQVGSVLELSDFSDEYFDLVLDGYCFHCIIGPDRARFLSSARRVLKPEAILHISTMCGEVSRPPNRATFDPASRCILNADGVATRYIGLSEDIQVEVQNAGFRVLDWTLIPRGDDDGDMDEIQIWAQRV